MGVPFQSRTLPQAALAVRSQLPLGGSLWQYGKVSSYAKGPILEGAGIERKRNDWGSLHCVSRRKGFYNSPCISTISAQKRLGQWVMRPFSLWRALISSVL